MKIAVFSSGAVAELTPHVCQRLWWTLDATGARKAMAATDTEAVHLVDT
ncbi:hypothetical protein [Streptomyces sp. TRM64462]|nr:hypothetical protein [Streptomyces sp. TRM64462]